MKINRIRLIFALLALLIYSSKSFAHFFYLAPMWISLELLNRQKSYMQSRLFSLFNNIFAYYTIVVIVNRSRNAQLGFVTEAVINVGEHFFYAIVIGLKLTIYLRIMTVEISKKQLVWIVTTLNIIGFFNEVFQNALRGRFRLHFIADAQKDMLVNLIGSLVFLVCALQYLRINQERPQLQIE